MGALKKRCKTVGCPNLHTNLNGYCDECNKKYAETHPREDKRESSDKRGYDWKWRKFAKRFLASNPKCAICGAPAEVVDHKLIPADVMMKEYGHFLLDPEYYQPLCRSCNTRKGAHEDRQMRQQYEDDKRFIAEHCSPALDAPGVNESTPSDDGPLGGGS